MLLSGKLIVDGPPLAIDPEQGGDINEYVESIESLKKLRLKRVAPAHGYVFEEPKPLIQELLDGVVTREADVLKALGKETMRVEDLVAAMYGEDIEDDAVKIASGNTLAHLLKLRSDGKVKGQKNFTAT